MPGIQEAFNQSICGINEQKYKRKQLFYLEEAGKICWGENLEPSPNRKLALQASKRSIRHPGWRGLYVQRHSGTREHGISRELQEVLLFTLRDKG